MSSQPLHPNLSWTSEGNPISQQFNDVYFSHEHGIEESHYVFLKHNQLPQRFLTANRSFTIAETGFGTGLNFLNTSHAFLQQAPAHLKLHFISFEKFPLSVAQLQQAHQNWAELAPLTHELQANIPSCQQGTHRLTMANGQIILDLWYGDVNETITQVSKNTQVDAWFLDGFAPAKNPEMWQTNLFQAMATLSKPSTTVATFTAAGFVRRGLIDAGFSMQKVKGFRHKRDMLQGHFQLPTPDNKLVAGAIKQTACEPRIAIIGGGIAAAQCLLSLEQRGLKADVFCDDKDFGHGASGNPQAALYPLLSPFNPELTQWFIQAFYFAKQRLRQVHLRHAFDLENCGVLQMAFDEKSAQKIQHMVEQYEHALPLRHVDADTASSLSGLSQTQAGLWLPDGAWVNAQAYTQACFKVAVASMTPYHGVRIKNMTPAAGQWLLIDQHQHQYGPYDKIILAQGANSVDLVQTQHLPLTPVRGQLSMTPTSPALKTLKTVLCAKGYLTPALSQQHCFGASYQRQTTDTHVKLSEHLTNIDKIQHSFAGNAWISGLTTEDLQGRVAYRMTSRDHLPFAGPLTSAPGVYLLSGLGSRGFCSASLTAESLIAAMMNEPSPLTQAQWQRLQPERHVKQEHGKRRQQKQ